MLGRLIQSADVFVQNLAPGAADRLGLGAAELRERHPRLVHCSISGYGGEGLQRSGASHAAIVPYGPFACADGQTVFIGIQNEREWREFCAGAVERAEMAEDECFGTNTRRVENREALHAEIERVFSRLPTNGAIERLEAAGVANARMRTVRGFLDHPQLEARDRWREFGSPSRPVWGLLPPATIEGVEPVMAPIPALGEHTEGILRELGYDEAGISTLKQGGVT